MEDTNFGFTLEEIGKVYKLTGNNCPDDAEVIVHKEAGAYWAECNYSLKTKTSTGDYPASKVRSTAEETLEYLLRYLQSGKDPSCEWVKL